MYKKIYGVAVFLRIVFLAAFWTDGALALVLECWCKVL